MLQVKFQQVSRWLKLVMNPLTCKCNVPLGEGSFFFLILTSTSLSGLTSVSSWGWGSRRRRTLSLEPELRPDATIGCSSGWNGWLGTSNFVSGEMGSSLEQPWPVSAHVLALRTSWNLLCLCEDDVYRYMLRSACNFFWLRTVHRFPTWCCKSHSVKNRVIGCTDR